MDATLNDAQRDAVNTLTGPLLVLAGAGSGKTRVVTVRIAKLINSGISPSRILAMTFTNKAANEMQSRIGSMISARREDQPEISTFHSLCVRILRRQIHRIGYPTNFTILDAADQNSICRKVLREIRISNASLKPSDLLYQIGKWKTQGIAPKLATQSAVTDKEHLAAVAFRRYQDELMRCGNVDFDDLLLLTNVLFRDFPEVRQIESARFDHILVDEYQDTNDIQYNIVKALSENHRNLCVVGDDDQSIYGFRGSDVRHILNFSRDWSGAKTVRLEDNYRSTEAILEISNRLIRFNAHRHDKVLTAARRGGQKPRIEQFGDEEHESQQVVMSIRRDLEANGRQPSDIAILFRTNEQPRLFETELRKHDVPYVLLGSHSFYDRKEVKDLVAYLRVIHHADDEPSMRRIINNPPRGISANTVAQLVEVATQRGVSLWQIMLDENALQTLKVPPRMAIRNFIAIIQSQQRLFNEELDISSFHAFLAAINYKKEVARNSDNDAETEQRWASVEEMANVFGSYLSRKRKPSLEGFLEEIALAESDFDENKDDQLDRNAVALLTLHASKGLEFPVVYMVGLEEGLLPHARAVAAEGAAIDEERRLTYVGVTRAQDELTLSLALTRRKWGRAQEQNPSRFLFEMIGRADNPHDAASKREAETTSN
ncbi:MAG: UvrD-helicase domain-containing protein [Planctomycetaceae bacterium]|jgi:DNA helicase II / ATP-dependent DNA helicase PcrA|nr:UvrD-helicase domain-containing protein [Planctomycetaceae bacterium]